MNTIKTIFIIEDSQIISEIISLRLKHEFKATTFSFINADHLMSKIDQYHPDLIILDYHLNNDKLKYSNGLRILQHLREEHNIPVIIFSGQSDKEKAIELIKHGANDYIHKDDDDFMDNLIVSIKNVFEIQNTKGQIQSFKSRVRKNILFCAFLTILGVGLLKYVL